MKYILIIITCFSFLLLPGCFGGGSSKADGRKKEAARQLKNQKKEYDLNQDGKPDVWIQYDSKGRMKEVKKDKDHDGKPDQFQVYKKGVLFSGKIDVNRDGKIDKVMFFDKDGKKPVKVLIDMDYDGYFDYWQTQNEKGVPQRFADSDGDRKPDKGGVSLIKARDSFAAQKYEEAIEHYQETLEYYSRCKRAYGEMGVTYIKMKKYKKAIEAYQMYLKLGGRDPEIKKEFEALKKKFTKPVRK